MNKRKEFIRSNLILKLPFVKTKTKDLRSLSQTYPHGKRNVTTSRKARTEKEKWKEKNKGKCPVQLRKPCGPLAFYKRRKSDRRGEGFAYQRGSGPYKFCPTSNPLTSNEFGSQWRGFMLFRTNIRYGCGIGPFCLVGFESRYCHTIVFRGSKVLDVYTLKPFLILILCILLFWVS